MKYSRFFIGLSLLGCFPAFGDVSNVELELNATPQNLIGAALQTAKFVQTGGSAIKIGHVTIGYATDASCTPPLSSTALSSGVSWPLIANQIFGLNAQGIYNMISHDFTYQTEVHSITVVFSDGDTTNPTLATFTGTYCTNNSSDHSFCCIKNVTCDAGVCTSADTIPPQAFTM